MPHLWKRSVYWWCASSCGGNNVGKYYLESHCSLFIRNQDKERFGGNFSPTFIQLHFYVYKGGLQLRKYICMKNWKNGRGYLMQKNVKGGNTTPEIR